MPVATQVAASLRDAIRFGKLEPGLRLSEQEIADWLNLSRQPVREAFIRLSGEGLLEAWPQRGTFVSKISTQEVMDSRFVREAVEADIVRLAARKSSASLEDRLEDLMAQQEAAEGKDPAHFMHLDEALHRTLAEAAGRANIWIYLQSLKSQMDRVRYFVAVELPLAALIRQHRDIVRAVIDGDEERAVAAMRLHLNQIVDDLPQIIDAHPDFFKGSHTGLQSD